MTIQRLDEHLFLMVVQGFKAHRLPTGIGFCLGCGLVARNDRCAVAKSRNLYASPLVHLNLLHSYGVDSQPAL